ncbi:hypothetical protein CHARACLAT_025787 [Characodon lateralis]|uniref:Secreted protein n=1 Tax=Characodon lateralis TaxID=208331 RepID=A0ABU7F858_9TELE|nr:hypothetical protein [Characodon lateralis]
MVALAVCLALLNFWPSLKSSSASNRFSSSLALYLAPSILPSPLTMSLSLLKKSFHEHVAATTKCHCGNVGFRVICSVRCTSKSKRVSSSTSLLYLLYGFLQSYHMKAK